MNAQAAIGVLPAFLLSLLLTVGSVGLCEYRNRDCSGQWSMVWLLLGLGTGYNTYNPNLRGPRND